MTDQKVSKRKPGMDFHESFASGEVSLPSPRATGLVFAAVAMIVAVIFRDSGTTVAFSAGISLLLIIASLTVPQLLQPLNIVWFRFGMLLHRVVNPLVMFLMFAIAFIPMGLIMRRFHDPLRLKKPEGLETYWMEPDAAETKLSSMKNQF